ncbi:MAG: hypothetical protein JW875_08110, partial [Spirochaetales bacterium]|nr:hypothetical protein [Spirochaetales bacterium]
MTTLFIGLIKTCYMFLSRTITFDTSAIGKKIVMDDEKEFTIFRRVRIKGNESPQAYFLVRFKPKKMKPEQNVVFSLLPMMVFMGFTG